MAYLLGTIAKEANPVGFGSGMLQCHVILTKIMKWCVAQHNDTFCLTCLRGDMLTISNLAYNFTGQETAPANGVVRMR